MSQTQSATLWLTVLRSRHSDLNAVNKRGPDIVSWIYIKYVGPLCMQLAHTSG